MMSEAVALIVAGTLSAVVAPLIAIAGTRWLKSLPKRKDLMAEIVLLWERVSALEKKNDELAVKLEDCMEQHRAATIRGGEMSRALAALTLTPKGTP